METLIAERPAALEIVSGLSDKVETYSAKESTNLLHRLAAKIGMDNKSRTQLVANIPRYFVYIALKGFGFGLIAAFWLIYLQQRRGFSLTEATFVDVSFFVAGTIGEVPTGIVADTKGRKTSMAIGATIMAMSIIIWALVPNVLLIVLAYMALAIGNTFLSGADEALFYESLQRTGRSDDYPRLVGRANATMVVAMAVGSLLSGVLGAINLIVPFMVAGFSFFLMLLIVLAMKEPPRLENSEQTGRKSYRTTLRQAITLIYTKPVLRYSMLYAVLGPIGPIIMESFFVPPQAIALGVPLVAIGLVVMGLQFMGILGSILSHRINRWLGEKRILFLYPVLTVANLLLLAVFQVIPALLFVGLISFLAAILAPILMTRIQSQVSDDLRATVLSLQSILISVLLAFSEPVLGYTADHNGFPVAYIGLAVGIGLLAGLLLWKGRAYLGQSTQNLD